MINVELLEQVQKQVHNEPDRWNQSKWGSNYGVHCGFIGCFAGWACVLSGYTVSDDAVIDSTGDRESVPAMARELLGVSRGQGLDLFAMNTTLEQFDAFVESARRNAGTVPESEFDSIFTDVE